MGQFIDIVDTKIGVELIQCMIRSIFSLVLQLLKIDETMKAFVTNVFFFLL